MPIDFITRDKGEIIGAGGNDIQLVEVEDDLSELGTPDTFHDLGEVMTSQENIGLAADEFTLENKEVRQTHGMDALNMTFQLAQSINASKFIIEIRDKFYALYWNKGKASGKLREHIGFGQVFIPSGENQRPASGGGITIEFRYLKAPATRIFDTAGTGANIALPTTTSTPIITLTAGEYFTELDT